MGGYAYAGNNPVSHSDPTGERVCVDACGSGADQTLQQQAREGAAAAAKKLAVTQILNGYTTAHRVAQGLLLEYLWMTYGNQRNVTSIDFETAIPKGGPKGGTGFADVTMTDNNTMYVWEVKHGGYGAEAAGAGEVLRYINAWNQSQSHLPAADRTRAVAGFDIPGVQGPVPVPDTGQMLVAHTSTLNSPGSGVYVYDTLDEKGNKVLPAKRTSALSLESAWNAVANYQLLASIAGAGAALVSAKAGTLAADTDAAVAAEAAGPLAGPLEALGLDAGAADAVSTGVMTAADYALAA
jgi:hypothetical protein